MSAPDEDENPQPQESFTLLQQKLRDCRHLQESILTAALPLLRWR